MTRRTAIGVVMGGWSSEREISLATGRAVADALALLGHRVVPFDLTRERVPQLASPPFDVAFLALHGCFGEDGCIQGLLEAAGVPYTGSGVLASAVAMDKPTAKALFVHHRIPTPPALRPSPGERGVVETAAFADRHGWPVVVKPAAEGSSVGVTIATDRAALPGALAAASASGARALVETFVEGRELTVGILGETALPAVEIRPKGGVYSWEAKYYSGGVTEYLVPAPLTEDEAAALAAMALRAHRALACRDYSRVDFRLDRDGRPWVLEVNTIPGMTATSLLPKAAASAGIAFPQLVGEILSGALARRGARV